MLRLLVPLLLLLPSLLSLFWSFLSLLVALVDMSFLPPGVYPHNYCSFCSHSQVEPRNHTLHTRILKKMQIRDQLLCRTDRYSSTLPAHMVEGLSKADPELRSRQRDQQPRGRQRAATLCSVNSHTGHLCDLRMRRQTVVLLLLLLAMMWMMTQ